MTQETKDKIKLITKLFFDRKPVWFDDSTGKRRKVLNHDSGHITGDIVVHCGEFSAFAEDITNISEHEHLPVSFLKALEHILSNPDRNIIYELIAPNCEFHMTYIPKNQCIQWLNSADGDPIRLYRYTINSQYILIKDEPRKTD